MAFTVIGPGHFLGSGHPDLREDLPVHLGLIQSVDAAKSWSVLSLGGVADFHALDVSGDRTTGTTRPPNGHIRPAWRPPGSGIWGSGPLRLEILSDALPYLLRGDGRAEQLPADVPKDAQPAEEQCQARPEVEAPCVAFLIDAPAGD